MSLFATLSEDGSYALTTPGYVALIALFIAVLLLSASLYHKDRRMSARQLSFSAMAIALATVTSLIHIYDLPMGGSVTLCSMLFIALVGYWFGLSAGLTAGVAFGILSLILGPYIVSIPQMICDYFLAFGALGLSGIFHQKKHGLLKGYLMAVLGRYFFSTLSGVVFFGAYAPSNFPNPLVYSLAYNGSYLAPEALLTVVVILLPPVANALVSIKQIAQEA